ASPAVSASASSTLTTWSIGRPAARPASATCCSSVPRITPSSTRAASRSRRITGIAGSCAGRPAGRAVPECGYLPEDVTDPDADTPSEYFAPDPSAEGGAVREPAVIAYRRAAVSVSAIPTLRGGVHG